MRRSAFVVLAALPFSLPSLPAAPESGRLEIRVKEARRADGAEAPLPCRIHLADPRGKPVAAPPGLPAFRDHFVCRGTAEIDLAPGTYVYTVARGPEYREVRGEVAVRAGEPAALEVELERWIDLAARGWWSGETHVHRDLGDVPLLLEAEDLHVAPVITQWNQRSSWDGRSPPAELVETSSPRRFHHVLNSEDERRGGALLFLHLSRPLELRGAGPEFPSPVSFLEAARAQPGAWVEVEKPFWWDAPTWMATGGVDAIGLANNHMCRSTMFEDEAWGRPRDAARLPAPRGNGFYTQELYYRFLNCGFRVPPTAGSASGVLPNPVGYNRAYVHLEGEPTYEAWFRGLAAGRSFVTNGPILLVEANGRLPGEVFRAAAATPLEIDLDIRCDGNDPLETVEVIRDGAVVESLRGDGLRGWLRPARLRFERSGWFLVRAIARVPGTFRFASTAPFYVEVGGERSSVHREDVEFFIAWIDERIAAIGKLATGELADPGRREAVLAPHRAARAFYEKLLAEAR